MSSHAPETTPIRVIVVDEKQITREGLITLLSLLDDVDVVGDAGDGAAALELVARHRPDVVLMDPHLPGLDGVEAIRRITAEHPGTVVLVLTTDAEDESIATARQAGALGYLLKDADRAEIAGALRSAAAAAPLPRTNPDGLTAREVEVLALIAAGLSNPAIATRLYIGQTTVKTHINNAFAKIGVHNRAEAVRYAYQHGLAQP